MQAFYRWQNRWAGTTAYHAFQQSTDKELADAIATFIDTQGRLSPDFRASGQQEDYEDLQMKIEALRFIQTERSLIEARKVAEARGAEGVKEAIVQASEACFKHGVKIAEVCIDVQAYAALGFGDSWRGVQTPHGFVEVKCKGTML